MDKYANKIIAAIVFLLAFDLWGVHAKLLYQLNPDKIGDVASTFSYVAMNENTITAMLFALVFAFVPVLVLTTISPKLDQYWLFVTLFAFFDGGAWFIYYNKTAIAHFETFGAGYYGLFIVFVVASVGFIRMRLDELEKEEPVKIKSSLRTKEQQQELENDKPVNSPHIKDSVHIFEKTTRESLNNTEGRHCEDVPVIGYASNKSINVVEFQKKVIQKTKDDDIAFLIKLVNDGKSQKYISEKMDWHPSKVSRTIKKLKDNGSIKP